MAFCLAFSGQSMGCGGSAQPKYEVVVKSPSQCEPKTPSSTVPAPALEKSSGSKPAAGDSSSKTADGPAPAAEASRSTKVEGSASANADAPTPAPTVDRVKSDNAPKRRPSLSEQTEEIERTQKHEGHVLVKDVEPSSEESKLRPSTVQTHIEIWWIDALPKLYGVDDSDELREDLREDAQSEVAKRCVAAPEDARRIITEWLHDCPNADARETFVLRVEGDLKKAAVADKKAKKAVKFNQDADGAQRKLDRKGTGFVTAAQVRSLMCQDHSDDEGSEESDQDEVDDEEFEAQLAKNLDKKGVSVRQAVCAETHEVDKDWKPPVYEKTPAQRKRIADAVSESFMFAALSHDQLSPVIDAFEEVAIDAGATVIEEGAQVGPTDRGLYVMESGEMDVFKKGKEGAVFTYTEMGQYFGDLALLYNAPRSATVISTKPSVLWSIDRTTFNMLVKDAVQKAKERRMQFLSSVEVLAHLSPDEVMKISDALRERTFGNGVHIIQENEEGSEFFILEKGTAAAFKGGEKVRDYKPADYFGELALIKDAPRAADVRTLEDCTVLSLDRKAFHRLLGPLDAMLQERAQSYVFK